MTTSPEASAQAPANESPVRTKLAAAAARAGARKATPRRRTSTTRKPTPTTSRNERAAKRGKYADRIAPAVKSGAALLAWRNPVAGRVIELQADAWAASLDRVAAEDPRVDAFLMKISGIFGKSGAWGDFMKENALMAAGVMVATGRAPVTGPAAMVMAMFAGALVDQATNAVAKDQVYVDAYAAGADPETYVADPRDVAMYAARLIEDRQDKVAERATRAAARGDEDQGDDTVTLPVEDGQIQVGPNTFAAQGWR